MPVREPTDSRSSPKAAGLPTRAADTDFAMRWECISAWPVARTWAELRFELANTRLTDTAVPTRPSTTRPVRTSWRWRPSSLPTLSPPAPGWPSSTPVGSAACVVGPKLMVLTEKSPAAPGSVGTAWEMMDLGASASVGMSAPASVDSVPLAASSAVLCVSMVVSVGSGVVATAGSDSDFPLILSSKFISPSSFNVRDVRARQGAVGQENGSRQRTTCRKFSCRESASRLISCHARPASSRRSGPAKRGSGPAGCSGARGSCSSLRSPASRSTSSAQFRFSSAPSDTSRLWAVKPRPGTGSRRPR
mmetsp:Transcript_9625/g.22389  ORF Transcript_9625/g.22389 Transcript_9625/m.22389 type:complete len:305 (-) Transcript_9625:5137-6051(-)